MTGHRITAVAVVIPARDEEELIRRCLLGVRNALRALPDHITTAAEVVLDGCRDDTVARAETVLDAWPEAGLLHVQRSRGRPAEHAAVGRHQLVHTVAGAGVGALRDLGIRHLLRRLRHHDPSTTWLLSTDADSAVPTDWALCHLEHATTGAAAVAGTADLDGPAGVTPGARRRYRELVRDRTSGPTHGHVYGANLGVRADAYLAVGGFPWHGSGEDHGLWERLRAAGYPLEQPTGVRVLTSARLRGRAAGGLADLLSGLDATDETAADAATQPQVGPA
ncbi:glycosyltransferase [Pseudonocardia sp. GCM10023141]|uniref:glycosyltransferase n=1 Tax=Pseudonocardia sp. GCM10023141 TaxID=3252653 RepID=UPI00361F59EE